MAERSDKRSVWSSPDVGSFSWPVTLKVGLITGGLWRGSGELSIAPGLLVCTPGRLTGGVSGAGAVQHDGTQIDVYIARLVPPNFNVTVPIRSQGQTVIASMSRFSRRRSCRLLRAAGFAVSEHVTWTDRGFRWIEMTR